MSSAEMDRDPLFAFNANQPDVANVRTATRLIACGPNSEPDFASAVIETASGGRVQLVNGQNPQVIQRSAGQTVTMGQAQAALVVERITPDAASAEILTDNRAGQDYVPRGTKSSGDDGLCTARPGRGGSTLGFMAAALAFVGAVARRRRSAGR
jgi:hypothetical protein